MSGIFIHQPESTVPPIVDGFDEQYKSGERGKKRYGPSRLLMHLLYNSTYDPNIDILGPGTIGITSIRTLARCLSVTSFQLNQWIGWLEQKQYIDHVSYTPPSYSRKPTSVKLTVKRSELYPLLKISSGRGGV